MRKIFLSILNFSTFNICVTVVIAILCFGISPAYAQKQAYYKTYEPQTGKVTNRFHTLVENIPSGGYKVHWVSEEGDFKIVEDYILSQDYGTLWWHVVDDQRKTDYTGERKGNELFISGLFSGIQIQKIIQLDDKAFYYNPKFGLVDFIRSKKESETFWGFRHDELKVYPMKAINEGVEVILVGGEDVEAIKVYWTVNDFRSTFFKRTYWFRKSDGMYVKQKVSGGRFRELVREQ